MKVVIGVSWLTSNQVGAHRLVFAWSMADRPLSVFTHDNINKGPAVPLQKDTIHAQYLFNSLFGTPPPSPPSPPPPTAHPLNHPFASAPLAAFKAAARDGAQLPAARPAGRRSHLSRAVSVGSGALRCNNFLRGGGQGEKRFCDR